MKDVREKVRPTLLPSRALGQVLEVIEFGARKYAPDDWREIFRKDKPQAQRAYLDAALRHIFAYLQGEDADNESRLPHLAHAAVSMLFILEYLPTPAVHQLQIAPDFFDGGLQFPGHGDGNDNGRD